MGLEYLDGRLESIAAPDGRLVAEYDETTGLILQGYRPEYWRKDHLGNTRLTFSDFDNNGVITFRPGQTMEITQEQHYYPFGMGQTGDWYGTVDPENRYRYNGKELNEELGLDWYDYGARWYDASIARFGTIDRFAEKYSSMTPYHYAANNPVNFIDVNGDSLGIAEEYRNQFNQILSNVFGEQAASNFDYTSTGMLIYNGNEKDFVTT